MVGAKLHSFYSCLRLMHRIHLRQKYGRTLTKLTPHTTQLYYLHDLKTNNNKKKNTQVQTTANLSPDKLCVCKDMGTDRPESLVLMDVIKSPINYIAYIYPPPPKLLSY